MFLGFGERDAGDKQESLAPRFCCDSWGPSVCPTVPGVLFQHRGPSEPSAPAGRGRAGGQTHLTLNTAPEPEARPRLGPELPRPRFPAPFSPRAPAAAGSETRQSCPGSGGRLLGAESTAAGPGTAPSAPAWNRGKAFPVLLRPAGQGPAAPGAAWSTRRPACPPSQARLPLCGALAEGQGWPRRPQAMGGGGGPPVNVPLNQDSDWPSRDRAPSGLKLRRSECPLSATTC